MVVAICMWRTASSASSPYEYLRSRTNPEYVRYLGEFGWGRYSTLESPITKTSAGYYSVVSGIFLIVRSFLTKASPRTLRSRNRNSADRVHCPATGVLPKVPENSVTHKSQPYERSLVDILNGKV